MSIRFALHFNFAACIICPQLERAIMVLTEQDKIEIEQAAEAINQTCLLMATSGVDCLKLVTALSVIQARIILSQSDPNIRTILQSIISDILGEIKNAE